MQKVWWLLIGGLCLSSGLIASRDIPLDSHEIFVAETTQEMSQRGDWLVPYFNRQPRLNKPPLSYWATGAIAAASGTLPKVHEWQVRLVSTLAGVILVLSSLVLGVVLSDRMTANVAGLLLVSSAGLFSYSHDARPDLLYAAWVSAMLAAFAWAGYRATNRPSPFVGAAGLAWLTCALAILTKGPHIPAMVLVGIALHFRLELGRWREVARVLRPLYGLLLVATLTIPWWWLLQQHLQGQQVQSSQLAGKLLVPALSRFGNPYYLYRPLQMLLPWLPLVIMALVFTISANVKSRSRFLWMPIIVTALGLSFGRQYRFFYMLPLLAGMAVLIAQPLARFWQGDTSRTRANILKFGLGVQMLLIVGCAYWVVQHAITSQTLAPVAMCIASGIGLALIYIAKCANQPASLRVVVGSALLMASLWPAAGITGKLWGSERFAAHRMATKAAQHGSDAAPLLTWGISPTVYVYYAQRSVAEVRGVEGIDRALAQSASHTLMLVARAPMLASIQGHYKIREIDRYRRGDTDDVLVQLMLNPPS